MLENDSNNTKIRYVVQVNGAVVSPKYTSVELANAGILSLSEEHQSIAEIVTVTDQGQELLLG